jgi:SAM-dependent methyltransferase
LKVGVDYIEGRTILEIGHGDNFGVALLFLAHGAKQFITVDRFESERNSTREWEIYRALRARLNAEQKERVDQVFQVHEARFTSSPLLLKVTGRGIEEIRGEIQPLSLDLILSRAVLEHIFELKAAINKMDELLKPGGQMIHHIDFRDHKIFSGCGFHPLTFLKVPTFLYPWMTKDIGGPNRHFISFYKKKMSEMNYHFNFYVSQVLYDRPLKGQVQTLQEGIHFTQEELGTLENLRKSFCKALRELPTEDLLIEAAHLVAKKPL